MAEIKRVTLHPLKEDGTIDTSINLYPKTLVDGVVDRDGNEVDIATEEELQKLSDSVFSKEETILMLEDKVDKVEGKQLSTNDFTDEYKEDVTLNTAYRHRHTNKSVLDGITQEDLDKLSTMVSANNAHIRFLVNNAEISAINLNQVEDESINIHTPQTAQEVHALPDYTVYAYDFTATLDADTNSINFKLLGNHGQVLSDETVFLPDSDAVYTGSYDSENNKIVLVKKSGETVDISLQDIFDTITAETTRATTKEQQLQTLINNEVSRATTAENTLDDKIDAEIARATSAENTKVDKVVGKQLSTNDFTNVDKTNVDANTLARHSHSNKAVLDTFTETQSELNAKINSKVDKISGKQLSTNDFTELYKLQVDANTADRHNHNNKTILDNTTASFTSEEKTKLSGIEANADVNTIETIKLKDSTTSTLEPDANKAVTVDISNKVDKISGKELSTNDFTDAYKSQVDNNTSARHTHANKSLLDTYSQTETDLASAVSLKHSHANKSVLDGITQSDVSNWDSKVSANNGKISIQRNGTLIDDFYLNQASDEVINISVPVNPSDIGAMPDTIRYGESVSMELDPLDANGTTIKTVLIDQRGQQLHTPETVSFPQITTNKNDIATLNTNLTNEVNRASGAESALSGRLDSVEEVIPSQASSQNQLADKSFVNSSIATETATFRGTYNIVTDLGLTTEATEQQIASAIATKLASLSITADKNDYVYVAFPNATVPTHFDKYDKYKYNGTSWGYEYTLNHSSFTAEQWAAINSGITSTLVGDVATQSGDNIFLGTNTFKEHLHASGLHQPSGTTLYLGNLADNTESLGNFIPEYSNIKSLGNSTKLWKDLYLSGNISDGTNSTTIANIVTKNTAQDISANKTFVLSEQSRLSPELQFKNYYTTIILKAVDYGLNISSGLHIDGGLFVDTDDTYNIGTSNSRFKHIYLSGSFRDGNNVSFGFTLPNSTNLTSNSELIDTVSAQNITGLKRLSGGIQTDSNNNLTIKGNTGINLYNFTHLYFRPSNDNTISLGESDKRFLNLYLSGNISDGTNSVTVANIATKDLLHITVENYPIGPAQTYNNVRIQIKNKGYGDVGYRINGGQWVLAYHYDYTDNTYNDVAKLEIACPDSGGVDDIFITSSGGTTIAHINEPGSTTDNPLDVTQYLQDGCSIEIWNDD